MSGFYRKIRRQRLRADILAQARAQGCTCTPDVTIPGIEAGKVRAVSVEHDNDCPHAVDNSLADLVRHMNEGGFDR